MVGVIFCQYEWKSNLINRYFPSVWTENNVYDYRQMSGNEMQYVHFVADYWAHAKIWMSEFAKASMQMPTV